jgi:hypothetical protein
MTGVFISDKPRLKNGKRIFQQKIKKMSRHKNKSVSRLFRKCEVDDEKNLHLPIPTQVISNEEHLPIEQTAAQRRVEHELTEIADRNAKRLGISRRKFLAASGGMAAAFLATLRRANSSNRFPPTKSFLKRNSSSTFTRITSPQEK